MSIATSYRRFSRKTIHIPMNILIIWGSLLFVALCALMVAPVYVGWYGSGLQKEIVQLEYQADSLQTLRATLAKRAKLAQAIRYLVGKELAESQVGILVDEIDRNAKLYDIDPILILSIVITESRGKSDAMGQYRSGNLSGAMGVMQVKAQTARGMAQALGLKPPTQRDLLDPAYNLSVGVAFLLKMVHRYGSLRLGIMAYNVGPGGLESGLRGDAPLPEAYYRKVWSTYRKIHRIMEKIPSSSDPLLQ